jgi:GTP-binding protein HflX
VAAFRATLEEIAEADLLLHVVDISHPNSDDQVAAVEEVLETLGASGRPVVTALNKTDRLDLDDATDGGQLNRALAEYPNAIAISAATGYGIDTLLGRIDRVLRRQMIPVDVLIPYAQGDLVSLFHQHGFVELEEHTESGTHLSGRLPPQLAGRYSTYWTPQGQFSQADYQETRKG